MTTVQQFFIALFVVAIVAVIVGSGQAASAIGDMGRFLQFMVAKINGGTQ